MKKILFLFTYLFLSFSLTFSQNIYLSGYITDSISGEKLINALVYEKYSNRSTTTNNFGYYSLAIPQQDSIQIIVSYFGYEKYTESLLISKNLKKDIKLNPEINQLPEVVISSYNLNDASTGVISLTQKELRLIPALGGERDLFKSFQLLPGVMQGNEGKSNIYVRGGSSDQNLIILDDVPLYSIDHFTGYFSVFNDDAINNVKMLKGGFPARYGGRLSSVIDVRMKDGNMSKFNGIISFGVLTSRLFLEGPLKKDKISYMISFRRSNIDLFLIPYYAIDRGNIFDYNFYDINSKINFKISDKDFLYLSVYSGDDKISTIYPDLTRTSNYLDIYKMRGGNYLTALRWNHIFGKNIFGNLTASYTKFRYYNSYQQKETSKGVLLMNNFTSIGSNIIDYSAKYELEYNPFSFVKINIGANYIYHIFNPAQIDFVNFDSLAGINVDTTFYSSNFYSSEVTGYVEGLFKISRFINLNIGFRENIYYVNNTKFRSHEPRAILNISATKNLSFKASYAKMSQNVHLMTTSDNEFFTSLWVPATSNCPPEYATHYAFAVETLIKNKFNIEFELYYKKMSNLIEFAGGSFWNNASKWESKAEKNGTGESYGFEVMINKKFGKLTGWIAYTYSKTTRIFENINGGKVYPFDFDRPHDFKIYANYNINKNLDFSVAWYFQSGRPFNMPIGYYYSVYSQNFSFQTWLPEVQEYYTELYAERNSFRMKPYHRLDLSINWTKEKKRGTRIWSFGVYNVYCRLNPYYYYFRTDTDENGKSYRKLYQYSMFPIIPSISYTFKF